jgi:hypothetical protein
MMGAFTLALIGVASFLSTTVISNIRFVLLFLDLLLIIVIHKAYFLPARSFNPMLASWHQFASNGCTKAKSSRVFNGTLKEVVLHDFDELTTAEPVD